MAAGLKNALRGVLYLLVPAAAAVLAIPIVGEISPGDLSSGDLHPLLVVLVVAFYVGVAAAPGYIYGVFHPVALTGLTRLWVRLSLVGALSAAIAAIGFTYVAFWPLVVLPLTTALLCGWLLVGTR